MLLGRQRKWFLPLPPFLWNLLLSLPLPVCFLDRPDLALWLGQHSHNFLDHMSFLTTKSGSWSLMGDWGPLSLLRRFLNAACTSCNKICWGKAHFVSHIEQGTLSLRYWLHFLFYFQGLASQLPYTVFLMFSPPPQFPWLDLSYIPFHIESLVFVHTSIHSDRLGIPREPRPHNFPLPPLAHACAVPASALLFLIPYLLNSVWYS